MSARAPAANPHHPHAHHQHAHHQTVVPAWVLVAAACMMVFSMTVAFGARQWSLAHPGAPRPAPTVSVSLVFSDMPDGSIRVSRAQDGSTAGLVPPREGGFVRGVLRGMMRTRKLESVGKAESFTLARAPDGTLSLTDPQTSRRVELNAFGPSNIQAFELLLAQATLSVAAR